MKIFILINLSVLLFINHAFSQGSCSNIIVESPLVAKPTNPSINVTCAAVTLQWEESPKSVSQSYIVSLMVRDPLHPAQIDTIFSPRLWEILTMTFPVTPGMIVSWKIQGLQTIDDRTFYSYALRSIEEVTIPDCGGPSIAATERPTASISESPLVTETEKVRVDLYPNPVHTVLNLNISIKVKTATAQNALLRVVGIDGKTVLTQKAAFGSVQVNVSRLSNSAYFIRVEDAGGKLLYIAKFIKE